MFGIGYLLSALAKSAEVLFANGSFLWMIPLILSLPVIIAQWRLLTKAGEKGWKALIPIYGTYTLFKICWNGKGFWVYLAVNTAFSLLEEAGVLIPRDNVLLLWPMLIVLLILGIAAIVINAKFCGRMAQAYGRSSGFAVGLFFLPVIFFIILGFGKAKYIGKRI